MKNIITLIVCCIAVVSCGPEFHNSSEGTKKAAERILQELNSWDGSELALIEGGSGSNVKPSGESLAWVKEHKESLKQAGYIAVWNETNGSYDMEPIMSH